MFTAAIDRTVTLLGRLAARPGLLLVTCLAANAVLLPYAGISRDAKQYSLQVVHAATGRYADDLFLRYGDQSGATVLPSSLAPAAVRFGVAPVFFVVYLVVNALRLWATQRLVLRLLGPSPGAAAGLLLAAAAPVPIGWGGLEVNEPVLTARAPAIAAVLFGLDCLLARRPVRAAGWLATGFALHPLMAAPAAAVAVGWAALGWASSPWRRAAVGVLGLVAVAGVAVYLARTAGTLDPEWRGLVLLNNPHVDPARWDALAWARLAAAAGCGVAVARALDPAGRRFLLLVVAAAVAGLAVAAVAARGPWALVFQGQAARAVWLLELLWFPLGMVTAGRLWGAGPGTRVAAVALLAVMLAGPNLAHPLAIQVLAVAAAMAVTGARVSGTADWAWRGLAAALVLWGAVWYTVLATVQLTTDLRPGSFFAPSLLDQVDALHAGYGPLPRLVVCLAVLTVAGVALRPRAWGAVAVATWAAASLAAFLLPRTEWAARREAPRAADVRLVQDVIAGSWDGAGPPTVYWPGDRMDTVWFDLGGNSYFTYWQLSPNIFFRGNAIEGARRWLLAAPFEADPDRPGTGSAPDQRPTPAQLRALAADPVVDYVVLPYDFGESAGTNGSVWVYDARVLRRAVPPS